MIGVKARMSKSNQSSVTVKYLTLPEAYLFYLGQCKDLHREPISKMAFKWHVLHGPCRVTVLVDNRKTEKQKSLVSPAGVLKLMDYLDRQDTSPPNSANKKPSKWVTITVAYKYYAAQMKAPKTLAWFRTQCYFTNSFETRQVQDAKLSPYRGYLYYVNLDSVDRYLQSNATQRIYNYRDLLPIDTAYYKAQEEKILPPELTHLQFKKLIQAKKIASRVLDDVPCVSAQAIKSYFQ